MTKIATKMNDLNKPFIFIQVLSNSDEEIY